MRRSSLAIAIVISIAYSVLVCGVFAPGAMSPDSVSHWEQAVHGGLNDWHPPLLPLIIRVAIALGASTPTPLIALQSFLLALGFQRLLTALGESSPPRPAPLARSLLAVPLLLAPPVILYAQVLWKDVWMTIAFLWASIGFLTLVREPRRASAWVLFVGAGVLATCLRHNAAMLLGIPYLVLLLGRLRERQWRAAAAISVSGVFTLLAPGLVVAASHTQRRHPEQVIYVQDIAGIEACTGFAEYASLDADQFLPEKYLREGYTPRDVVPLFLGPEGRRINHEALWTQMPRLRGLWKRLVFEQPRCYLRHRAAVFHAVLGVSEACYPFEVNIVPNNDFGFEPRPLWPALRDWAVNRAMALQDGLLFRSWPYSLAALLLALLARGRPVRWLLASGLFYVLAYFFVGTTCDFRMSWVLVPLVFAAGADALLRLPLPRSSQGASSSSGGP